MLEYFYFLKNRFAGWLASHILNDDDEFLKTINKLINESSLKVKILILKKNVKLNLNLTWKKKLSWFSTYLKTVKLTLNLTLKKTVVTFINKPFDFASHFLSLLPRQPCSFQFPKWPSSPPLATPGVLRGWLRMMVMTCIFF